MTESPPTGSGRDILVLEDGRVFEGRLVGASGETAGEVVFNTSMTGYQEILTDPSYRGQIVCLTHPHVGNTGANPADPEAAAYQAAGLVCRDLPTRPSSWRATASLDASLAKHGMTAIQGVDTRALVRHIRSAGAMRGAIGSGDPDALRERARSIPSMKGRDLVSEATCDEPHDWTEPLDETFFGPPPDREGPRPLVACLDLGAKRSIFRRLVHAGCRVRVLPADTPADEVLATGCDGIALSNGPGDPAAATGPIETVRELIGERPVLGVCMGHQLLALALGAETYKLKFGHRGGNHPVRDHLAGGVVISAHNHGFAVDADTLPDEVEPLFTSLFDGTLEGFRVPDRACWAIQFHPEAAPGPHDAAHVFEAFADRLRERVTATESSP